MLRPLEFYKELIKQLDCRDKEVGHFFERSWYCIFNLHKEHLLYNPDILIVGSGLYGSVIAEKLASNGNNVLIIEKRNHIGGNCYDYIDEQSGILVSKYGAHIFHTNNEEVWKYVNKFSKWIEYKHKVYGKSGDKYFPVPINITTVNTICDTNIKNEEELNEYLDSVRDLSILEPKNSEEYCLSKFGKELYEKVIKEYTYKQWNKYPDELNPSVLQRISLRKSFEEGYFDDKYQALPEKGYTKFIENIINNKNILVLYNTDYEQFKKSIDLNNIYGSHR